LLDGISLAWQVASPDERNKLAPELFNSELIENKATVAVRPRPELLPFFEALAIQSSSVMAYERKRRDSNPRSQP
jgi:hypothetical protein